MRPTPLIRMIFFGALAALLQTGLIACGGKSSDTPGASSVDPQAAAHLVEAQSLLKKGDVRSALAHTDSAVAITLDAADAYFLRGRIFSRLSQPEKAEGAYRRALSIDPDKRGAWFNIGNLYFRRRQFASALKQYAREEERHPSPSLYVHMAQSYSELGKTDSAVYAYERALALDSTYAPAHAWLGQLYREDGRYERALTHTEQALALDSTNLKYRFFTGQLLLSTGRPEAAVEHLQRVVRGQPWHYAAHYNLGRAYARLGREQTAERYLARADTLQKKQADIARLQTMARERPDQPGRWVELAQTLQDVGHLERARDAYGIALSLAPGNVAIENNLANLSLALGDTTTAIKRYRSILERDSTYAGVWLNLGVVYIQMGRREQAIDAWRQALRYNPDDRRIKAYLNRVSGNSP